MRHCYYSVAGWLCGCFSVFHTKFKEAKNQITGKKPSIKCMCEAKKLFNWIFPNRPKVKAKQNLFSDGTHKKISSFSGV